MSEIIFKLADQVEWDMARAIGAYVGSAVDKADGYIHFSTVRQIAETARKHYAGRGGLILAEIDVSKLGQDLVWEPSRGGDLFPHLYGALPFAAVIRERHVDVDAEGAPHFEDGASAWA